MDTLAHRRYPLITTTGDTLTRALPNSSLAAIADILTIIGKIGTLTVTLNQTAAMAGLDIPRVIMPELGLIIHRLDHLSQESAHLSSMHGLPSRRAA